MSSYGTSPAEGGTHYIMCPTFPGQAWSEGYATWHSAAVRNQPLLEDKQGGGFFWFDINSRTYYPNSSQPSPIDGLGGTNLLGEIDENAVAERWHGRVGGERHDPLVARRRRLHLARDLGCGHARDGEQAPRARRHGATTG